MFPKTTRKVNKIFWVERNISLKILGSNPDMESFTQADKYRKEKQANSK